MDFYPSDWLIQTGGMTPVQRGIFVQVVAMIYANRGPIDNDPSWIGRAANCSSRLARTVLDQLVEVGSLQIQGSKITQRRCERELNSKRTHLELAAKGGRKKAENAANTNHINGLASSEGVNPVVSTTAIATAIAKKENPPFSSPQGGNPKPKRAARLTEDWRPGEDGEYYAAALNLDFAKVFRDFQDYWLAKAGPNAVKADWSRTWQRWCRTAAEGGKFSAPSLNLFSRSAASGTL